MSDTVYKIFPRYYYPIYPDDKIKGAVNTLRLTAKEDITFTNFESVQFIDCGEGLAHIFCPWCGRDLDFDFWKCAMNEAFDGKAFHSLALHMPCCGLSSSLDELIYVKPCGFATFVIEVWNPAIIPCMTDLHEMDKCFGRINFFRMISNPIIIRSKKAPAPTSRGTILSSNFLRRTRNKTMGNPIAIRAVMPMKIMESVEIILFPPIIPIVRYMVQRWGDHNSTSYLP